MADTLNLRRQVIIKAIVTDTFKQQASAELQAALQNVDMNLQQLEFQGKRAIADLEKKNITPAGPMVQQQIEGIKQQIEGERGQLMAAKNDMLQKLNMIGQLDIGSEFVQAQVDNFVDVAIGDNLYLKLSSPEVIVKDGVVVEIRQPEMMA
ncbi:YlqD family protein [bacterium]|nr:YlqD family protein [bacterium]